MARRTAASINRDILKAVTDGKKLALARGVAVLYKGVLDDLAAGSPGQGRAYRRGRKVHRASVAGAAPARDTGTLIRAIGYQIAKDGNSAAVGVKSPASAYAKILDPEPGKAEPRIGRRLILSQALARHGPAAKAAIQKGLEEALRRATGGLP